MAVKSLCITIGFIVNILAMNVNGNYEFPPVLVKVLTPRGFQVSIPDSPGIQLFAFHGNINQEMVQGLEAGQFSVDINRKYNGRWTYTNPTASLNPGDTLYFWTYVIVDGKGYQKLFQKFTVPLDIDPIPVNKLPPPPSTPRKDRIISRNTYLPTSNTGFRLRDTREVPSSI